MPQETFSSSLFLPRSDRAGFKPGSLTTRCHVDHPGLEANIQISVAILAIHSSCCLHPYKYYVYPWQFFELVVSVDWSRTFSRILVWTVYEMASCLHPDGFLFHGFVLGLRAANLHS